MLVGKDRPLRREAAGRETNDDLSEVICRRLRNRSWVVAFIHSGIATREHRLMAGTVGANGQAIKHCTFGLDYAEVDAV